MALHGLLQAEVSILHMTSGSVLVGKWLAGEEDASRGRQYTALQTLSGIV